MAHANEEDAVAGPEAIDEPIQGTVCTWQRTFGYVGIQQKARAPVGLYTWARRGVFWPAGETL